MSYTTFWQPPVTIIITIVCLPLWKIYLLHMFVIERSEKFSVTRLKDEINYAINLHCFVFKFTKFKCLHWVSHTSRNVFLISLCFVGLTINPSVPTHTTNLRTTMKQWIELVGKAFQIGFTRFWIEWKESESTKTLLISILLHS